MINYIKSLFKPTIIQVNNIQDLFPLYAPDKFVIGTRKGAVDPNNLAKLHAGLPFQFNGTIGDFIILPKSNPKELE